MTATRRTPIRGYVRGLGVDSDVIEDIPDLRALADKGDQAHLLTAIRAQQREHLVDSGDQHCPQVVRCQFDNTNARFVEGKSRLANTGKSLKLP